MSLKIAHEKELKKMEGERDFALDQVGVRKTEMENKQAENDLLRVTNTDKDQEIADLQTRLNAVEADLNAADPNQGDASFPSVHTSEAHTAEGSISSNGDAVTQPPPTFH